MKVELHIIQNFAPSCLNRDDTNSPKDCEFGGFRRARISSQCIKRSVRTSPVFEEMVCDQKGIRTKHLHRLLRDRLLELEMDCLEVDKLVPAFVSNYSKMEGNKTKVLLYLGEDEINTMVEGLVDNWNKLVAIIPEEGETSKSKKQAFEKAVNEVFKACKGGTKAVDIALFGRMVAESPIDNIAAASQVAHAISTHRVNMEMDFYTAVDDLLTDDELGAGMMGTVEFNSACFYRYSLVDVEQLRENLGKDRELCNAAVEAFIKASIQAIPTGKQTSMAAHNPPSFVMVVIRESGAPQSFVNAFEKPVVAAMQKGHGLVEQSILRLDRYCQSLDNMYGTCGIKLRSVCLLDDFNLENLNSQKVDNITELIGKVREALI